MRSRATALILVLALGAGLTLLLTPAAGAAVSWVVRGHGFGHGVGVSQYGAYGFALNGKGYRFILRHYYRGTRIGRVQGPQVVRVLLAISPRDIAFSGATSACGRTLDPRRSYAAHRNGARVKLRNSGGKRLADCGKRLRAAGRGRIRIDGAGVYRGAFEAVPTESNARSLNAINAVPLEQYVKGVIANESPPSWPVQELRAQAVESRSLPLTAGVEGNGFDLYADTRSQVYGGLASETARTNAAVAATRGEVVMYGNKVATTFYSACSGGYTESVQNVFFGPPIPYLTGVPDPYDHYCPLHDWTLRFSGPEISAKLGAGLRGRLKRVVVTKRGVSPRIVTAKLVGTRGTTKVSGEQLQVALGAYSTWMNFHKVAG